MGIFNLRLEEIGYIKFGNLEMLFNIKILIYKFF